MSQIYSTGSIYAEDVTDILYKIRDNIGTIGWEVVDDRIDSIYALGIKSPGDHTTPSCYVYIIRPYRVNYGDYIGWKLWSRHGTYFNDQTNTYHNAFGYIYNHGYTSRHPWYYPDSHHGGVLCDSSTYNTFTIRGNKDLFLLDIFKPSNQTNSCIIIFKIDNFVWGNKIGVFKEETISGPDIVAKLHEGEASYFKQGYTYRLSSPLGPLAKSKITDIDTINDTVTFESIVYPMASGTKCGKFSFPWVSAGYYNYSSMDLQGVTWDVGNINTTRTNLSSDGGPSNYFSNNTIIKSTVENYKKGDRVVSPVVFYDSHGVLGSCSYLYNCNYGSYNNVIGVNNITNGHVFSSTENEIFDDDAAWNVDSLKGLGVIITSGEQENSTRKIISNTYNTFTVDPPFPTAISGTETYTICEAFYRKIPITAKMGSNIYLKDI